MPHAHAHGRKQQLARSHGVGKHARGERTADAAGQRVSATAGGSEDRSAARCRPSAARGTHGRDRLEAQADERVALRAKLPQPLCGAHLHRQKLAPRLRRDSRCSATPRPIAEHSPSTRRGLAERPPHSRSAGGAAALGTHLREVHAVRRRDLHAALARVRAESSPLLTAGIGLSGIQLKWESA